MISIKFSGLKYFLISTILLTTYSGLSQDNVPYFKSKFGIAYDLFFQDVDSARNYISVVIDEAKSLGDCHGVVGGYHNYGWMYSQKLDFHSAVIYYLSGIEYGNDCDLKGRGLSQYSWLKLVRWTILKEIYLAMGRE